ncbi:hypothetical protein GSI_05909 [Ganoderma sinense ZZ0214-1]|uniref:Uncharacterized protein n=1 Tax=Ganoderma sinense ZZ0214-1 TaxID=1077348 RepID=A0A2G8SBT7_9APHY|nr:hypothetical protein GSI_05909 [Ganoderma sinense ZZ0214-1]
MPPSREQAGSPRVPSNDGQLINNLPAELFVQVLEDVYWLRRRSEIDWEIDWDTNWTVPYQLVCRRWRDVICSTPQFWQRIDIRSNPRWLDLCLTRCDGAPVSVKVWNTTSPDGIFGTLCHNAASIRAFRLHCDFPYLSYLSGLPSLLATPMTILETLSVIVPFVECELDVPLTHHLVPRLTSLELWNCTAPRDLALYASLRSLTFVGTTWAISYSEFLDVLSKCPSLEHLSLDEDVLCPFAEELADHPTGTQHRTTPLVLPRLSSMTVHGLRGLLVHFLATIHVPQATTIELKNCFDEDEPGPLVSRLLVPNPQLRIPFLSSLRTVSLSCWDGNPFQLSLRGGPDGNALFSLDYGTIHDIDWPGNTYLERNLVAIIDTFPVAAIDTLEVEGCLDLVAVETWHRVFQTFSSLRTLRVKGRGTLDFLWSGLACATTSSLERGGAVCCPYLSEIEIDDRPWISASRFKFTASTGLFDIVRGTLSARENAGATRLKKLQLYLEYMGELWTRTSERRATWVEDVKALVEELDYRDWQA